MMQRGDFHDSAAPKRFYEDIEISGLCLKALHANLSLSKASERQFQYLSDLTLVWSSVSSNPDRRQKG
jgi:hypothetical protein